MDVNISNSIQSAAGLKALRLAANGRYLMLKSRPYVLTFTVQKYIYPSVIIVTHCRASVLSYSDCLQLILTAK